MAKYEVARFCGCVETHQIIGPHKQRASKIEWLEARACREHWIEEKAEANESAAKEALASTALELPELKGSEKQVKWALDIRNGAIRALQNVSSLLVPAAACSTSAKGWIDYGREAPVFYCVRLWLRSESVEQAADAVGRVLASRWLTSATVHRELSVADLPDVRLDAAVKIVSQRTYTADPLPQEVVAKAQATLLAAFAEAAQEGLMTAPGVRFSFELSAQLSRWAQEGC
jgi:hypothetical protein